MNLVRFEDVRGQERAISRLRTAIDSGRVASAYLFLGPPGVGKRTTAIAFAAALECREGGTSACGECRSCRDISRGEHPDVSVWQREEGKRIFGIPRVREVIASMSMKSYAGGWKVTIVDEADTMNDEAANAFLLTLEEPPPGTVLVLIAANARALPETIASRCQSIVFQPLDAAVVAELLVAEGVEPGEAGKAARTAEGSLDSARESLGEAWARIVGRVAAWAADFALADAPDPLHAEIAGLGNRDDADRFLAVIQQALRESVRKSAGIGTDEVADGRSGPGAFAADWPLPAILAAMEAVDLARKDLKSNLNQRVVVENFAMDLYVIRRGRSVSAGQPARSAR